MVDIHCLEQLNVTDCVLYKSAGQKVVYKANSEEYGNVVIKVIRPNQNVQRIFREIEIVESLSDVTTSKIFKHGSLFCDEIEYLYIIESFIDGQNLREHLESVTKISIEEVCYFLKMMLNVVVKLEENSLVHRDIKPENIMRTPNGEYILIDFGIARDLSRTSFTDTASPRGPATLAYAPIEQIDNEKSKIDSRTDLYSLCLVAYEMISGTNPFLVGCSSDLQLLRKIDKGVFTELKDETYQELFDFIHTNMNRYRTRRVKNAKEAQKWFNDISSSLCKGA